MSSGSPTTRTFKTARQVEMDRPVKNKKPRKPIKIPKKKTLQVIGIILMVVILAALWQYRSAQQKANIGNDQKIISDIKKVFLLPENEEPEVRLVGDADKLKKDYPFFKDAKNGDKLFVYDNAGKIILYRPSTKMIINVQVSGQ